MVHFNSGGVQHIENAGPLDKHPSHPGWLAGNQVAGVDKPLQGAQADAQRVRGFFSRVYCIFVNGLFCVHENRLSRLSIEYHSSQRLSMGYNGQQQLFSKTNRSSEVTMGQSKPHVKRAGAAGFCKLRESPAAGII